VSQRPSDEYDDIVARYGELVKYYVYDRTQSDPSLGAVRNFSIEKSTGDYFCNWDDDDWFHIDRIKLQLHAAVNNCKAGSILAYCLLYDKLNQKAYLSHPMFHPGSILLKKSMIKNDLCYPSLNKGEDDGLILKLHRCNALFPLINPRLFVYVYHGTNTWNVDHFNEIFSLSTELSGLASVTIKRIVNAEITFDVASAMLHNSELLEELNYFRAFTLKREKVRA
jgi:glycosyltransferase involved in cell wall biosynthesis